MKTFGLTGGIGMGKSTVAQMLAHRGVNVIDTDDLAREIVAPGQPALAIILQTFGADLLDNSGHLRRAALAQIVFLDPAARAKLEAITHPRIMARWREQLAEWRTDGQPVAVVVIPLLYEIEVAAEFDAVICVACSSVTQQKRLQQRGWTAAQIQERCAAQLPVAEKIARANFVVWTEGEVASTAAQLTKIISV
jgi:dephospho-CoA kinase